MTVAADLLNLAARDSGVLGTGQAMSGQEMQDTLRRCNQMLAQWNARRWLIYHLVDTAFASTGAQSYTVGPGGNFNIPRVDRLEGAYIRQVTSPVAVDYDLEEIFSREEYSQIALKGLTGAPSRKFFFDSDNPTGVFYPWPISGVGFEYHILTKAVLNQFATPADAVVLPSMYEDAIYYSMMVRLRAANRLPADPQVIRMAKAALNTVRKANFQIARLKMPRGVVQGPTYNPLSDRGV